MVAPEPEKIAPPAPYGCARHSYAGRTATGAVGMEILSNDAGKFTCRPPQ